MGRPTQTQTKACLPPSHIVVVCVLGGAPSLSGGRAPGRRHGQGAKLTHWGTGVTHAEIRAAREVEIRSDGKVKVVLGGTEVLTPERYLDRLSMQGKWVVGSVWPPPCVHMRTRTTHYFYAQACPKHGRGGGWAAAVIALTGAPGLQEAYQMGGTEPIPDPHPVPLPTTSKPSCRRSKETTAPVLS